MNCPKCGGLVEKDRDPESLTTRHQLRMEGEPETGEL
jgi:hypothetical protein